MAGGGSAIRGAVDRVAPNDEPEVRMTTRSRCAAMQRAARARAAVPTCKPDALAIPVGARVDVKVDDERGRRWYPARVVAHGAIGTAHRPGGWPTYDVATDDGRRYDACAPECVRTAKGGAR